MARPHSLPRFAPCNVSTYCPLVFFSLLWLQPGVHRPTYLARHDFFACRQILDYRSTSCHDMCRKTNMLIWLLSGGHDSRSSFSSLSLAILVPRCSQWERCSMFMFVCPWGERPYVRTLHMSTALAPPTSSRCMLFPCQCCGLF